MTKEDRAFEDRTCEDLVEIQEELRQMDQDISTIEQKVVTPPDLGQAAPTPNGLLSKRYTLAMVGIVGFTALTFLWKSDPAAGIEKGYVEGEPASPVPSPHSYAARTIATSDGSFNVPGFAYVNGTDPKAMPPATLMNIAIWDAASRTRSIGTLPHGTKVYLLYAKGIASERRYYFRVRAEGVEGWLPESALSTDRKDPIGDQFNGNDFRSSLTPASPPLVEDQVGG